MTQAFSWNNVRERAAERLAVGGLSDRQIAEEIGVGLRTLRRWKSEPEFQMRIASIVAAFREKALEFGIADIRERVRGLNERQNRHDIGRPSVLPVPRTIATIPRPSWTYYCVIANSSTGCSRTPWKRACCSF
jgi:hypothetical protein